MTDQQLVRRLLDLANECEIAGRDMTAQALRDMAADAMTNPQPNQMRHMRAFINQLVRK